MDPDDYRKPDIAGGPTKPEDRTANGYDLADVTEALTDDIMRGDIDSAGQWAYELAVSGYGHELWPMFASICARGIGLEDMDCIRTVHAARAEYERMQEGCDGAVQLCMVIAMHLAQAPKSRLVEYMHTQLKAGGIPDTGKPNRIKAALDNILDLVTAPPDSPLTCGTQDPVSRPKSKMSGTATKKGQKNA